MKIYLIDQSENTDYDTWDSAVVIAENEEEAKKIHPNGYTIIESFDKVKEEDSWYGWTTDINKISATYLGEAKEGSNKGVICSSFNAG